VVSVDELEVADPADAWTRAGFSVGADACAESVASAIRLAGVTRSRHRRMVVGRPAGPTPRSTTWMACHEENLTVATAAPPSEKAFEPPTSRSDNLSIWGARRYLKL